MILSGEITVCDWYKWRYTIHESNKIFQEHSVNWANLKCVPRKGDIIDSLIHGINVAGYSSPVQISLATGRAILADFSEIMISATLEMT